MYVYSTEPTLKDFISVIENDDAETLLSYYENYPNKFWDYEEKTKMRPLDYAAFLGKESIIDKFLAKAIITTPNMHNGATALHYAAQGGNIDTLLKLIPYHNYDYQLHDNRGNNLMHYACNGGQKEAMFFLGNVHNQQRLAFNSRNNLGSTPMHIAASTGNLEIMKFLHCSNYIPSNERTAYDIKDKYDQTPLHIAKQKGYEYILKFLDTPAHRKTYPELFVEIKQTNQWPFTIDSLRQTQPKLKPKPKPKRKRKSNQNGPPTHIKQVYQPLNYNPPALKDIFEHMDAGDSKEIIKDIQKSSDLFFTINDSDTIDDSDTELRLRPLDYAAFIGNIDILKLFHNAGFDLKLPGDRKTTLMHYAAMNGHLKTMKFLHETCALSYNEIDYNLKKPIDCAKEYRHGHVVNYLIGLHSATTRPYITSNANNRLPLPTIFLNTATNTTTHTAKRNSIVYSQNHNNNPAHERIAMLAPKQPNSNYFFGFSRAMQQPQPLATMLQYPRYMSNERKKDHNNAPLLYTRVNPNPTDVSSHTITSPPNTAPSSELISPHKKPRFK